MGFNPAFKGLKATQIIRLETDGPFVLIGAT